MCGRFTGYDGEDEDLKTIYDETRAIYPDVALKSGDIFPTDTYPVITAEKTHPMPAVWGYPGFDGKGVIINARAETVTSKYMFKDSFNFRRCIIPAKGYYEWDKSKNKYYFNLREENLLFLAGFYKRFDDKMRFVVLTTVPNSSCSFVHNRMPLIVKSDMKSAWLGDSSFAADYLNANMPSLDSVLCK